MFVIHQSFYFRFMQVEKINFEDTDQFSSIFNDFINGRLPVLPPRTLEQFDFPEGDFPREDLVKVLKRQYGSLASETAMNNIQQLASNTTYTVTTGHQLNLATGPLYTIFKAISVINLAKALTKKHKDYHIVPVFWLASEDHDIEEVNHFNLFGKTYHWDTKQIGPVGPMKTKGIKEMLSALPEEISLLNECYAEKTMVDATRKLLHHFFGHEGLVVLDADAPELKKHFQPIVRKELDEEFSSMAVNKANEELRKQGYKIQVNPRDINLFYIENGLRGRIVRKGKEDFMVEGTKWPFSKKEMDDLVEKKPEAFSPNVLLRPVYQQLILPNIAYVGGPAEIAYWLQLPGLFKDINTYFPALVPRHFGMILNGGNLKKYKKLNLKPGDLFLRPDLLKNELLDRLAEETLNFEEEQQYINKAFDIIQRKVQQADPSLKGFVEGENKKSLKQLENIERRIRKAEEQQHLTKVKQAENLKEKLFPEGTPQERYDNIFTFYINDKDIINKLIGVFEPLDYHYYILADD